MPARGTAMVALESATELSSDGGRKRETQRTEPALSPASQKPPIGNAGRTGSGSREGMDNLPTLLTRGALHAPNFTPDDGLPYRTIHNLSVQVSRHDRPIAHGPGGTCHDYVPFYFGTLSVMLLNLKTGRVPG
jgi:hypothetical protein